MMRCQSIQQCILGDDWDRQRLDDAQRILSHLETCASCREALDDYDVLRETLRPDEAAQKTEPPSGWKSFEASLVGSGLQGRLKSGPMGWALAASLGLALVGWGLYFAGVGIEDGTGGGGEGRLARVSSGSGNSGVPRATGAPDDNRGVEPKKPRRISADERVEYTRMFASVSEVFEGRAGWVSLAGRASDVGMAKAQLNRAEKILMLKLVVTRQGQEVSNIDLIIVPGQTADLTSPFVDGQTLRYHVSTSDTEPRRLSIWAEVRGADGRGSMFTALATHLKDDSAISGSNMGVTGQLVTTMEGYRLDVEYVESDFPAIQGGRG